MVDTSNKIKYRQDEYEMRIGFPRYIAAGQLAGKSTDPLIYCARKLICHPGTEEDAIRFIPNTEDSRTIAMQ